MSIFAPDAIPEWVRVTLFWLGVALLLLGSVAALLHFRPRGWFGRNVSWRFRLRQPGPLANAEENGEAKAAEETVSRPAANLPSEIIMKRLRREKLDSMATQLRNLSQRQERDVDPVDGRDRGVEKNFEILRQNFADMGFSADEMNAQIALIADQVRADAKYAQLAPEDAGRFLNINAKRNWHIRKATISYMATLIEEARRPLGISSDDLAPIRIVD